MMPWLETWMGTEDGGFWAMPVFLFALVLVPVLSLWVWMWAVRHRRIMGKLFSGQILERVLPKSVRWRRTVRAALFLMAFLLVILALAEPRYGKRVHLFEQKGVDMVLILDLSSSMEARDVDPSRIERARREVTDLVELLGGDRVGLVIYAGGAYPRMPLTQDHNALQMLVEEASTRDFQIQGSALDQAIDEAVKLLTNDATSTAGKCILILSDGEVHNVASAFQAGQRAAEKRIQIYGLGIGHEPAPIPLEHGGYMQGKDGQVIMTRPSSDVLVELARMTGGAFTESVPSNMDVERLYIDGVQRSLEAGLTGERQEVSWQSGYQWPLGIGLFFALLGAWMGEGRRRWGAAAAALLAIGLMLPQGAMAGSRADGDAAYRMGNYSEADRIFSELLMESPSDPDLYGRLGVSRYRNGDYDGAARAFQRKKSLEDGKNPETLFNLGNSYYQSGRLEDAIEQYDSVLEHRSEHPGASHNKSLAEQEIVARRAVQPPQQNEEKEKDDQNQENEKNDGDQNQQGGSSSPQGDSPQNPQDKQEGKQDPSDQQGSSSQSSQKDSQQSQQAGDGQEATQKSEGEKAGSEGQERDPADETEGVNPGDLGEDPTEGSQGGEAGDGTKEGGISAEEAERILDGVEEGRPRVVIPGHSEGKPW